MVFAGLLIGLYVASILLGAESLPGVVGLHVRDCDFVAICPIKSAGWRSWK
jgi:hypothetical protein